MTKDSVAAGLGVAVIAIGYLGFYIQTVPVMPDNAVLILDHAEHEYLSPPCLRGRPLIPGEEVGTKAKARSLEYQPNRRCADDSGFVDEPRSLWSKALRAAGLLGNDSRWTEDGNWVW